MADMIPKFTSKRFTIRGYIFFGMVKHCERSSFALARGVSVLLSGVSGVFSVEDGVTDAAPSLRLYFCLRKADLPPCLGVERSESSGEVESSSVSLPGVPPVPSPGLSGAMSGASSSGGGVYDRWPEGET